MPCFVTQYLPTLPCPLTVTHVECCPAKLAEEDDTSMPRSLEIRRPWPRPGHRGHGRTQSILYPEEGVGALLREAPLLRRFRAGVARVRRDAGVARDGDRDRVRCAIGRRVLVDDHAAARRREERSGGRLGDGHRGSLSATDLRVLRVVGQVLGAVDVVRQALQVQGRDRLGRGGERGAARTVARPRAPTMVTVRIRMPGTVAVARHGRCSEDGNVLAIGRVTPCVSPGGRVTGRGRRAVDHRRQP